MSVLEPPYVSLYFVALFHEMFLSVFVSNAEDEAQDSGTVRKGLGHRATHPALTRHFKS